MPSIEESKRQVKAGIAQSAENNLRHSEILASHWDEIDKHNRSRRDEDERVSSSKFRFKSGTSDPRKRKHSKDGDDGGSHRRMSRRSRKRREDVRASEKGAAYRKRRDEQPAYETAAHPFPREPTKPDGAARDDPGTAFRDSLFDALADDEGAAYWESVYSQPIHVYPRPTVETARGELEQMNDEQYAAYVQTRMWEKKNPQIFLERERKEKERREIEEERTRQRDEFVQHRQRAAWERAQADGARKFTDSSEKGYKYVINVRGTKHTKDDVTDEFRLAWSGYIAAWDKLKLELLEARENQEETGNKIAPSKRIPWPVLPSKPVTKPNIEEFLRHAHPADEGTSTKLQLLKMERVKWHPDKIQQRFAGKVDDGTMKVVTGIFHVVDALLDDERKRES